MQITSWPFWFKIASTAMAVLPVWRSPMMSSRWPRPMGTMASMARMPVWRGTVTGSRVTTPLASCSMGRVSVAWTGPSPSMGCPSTSTTRPIRPSPTGTSAGRPVRRTRVPSRTPFSLPSSTTPTLSRERSMTMPLAPVSSSTSSPYTARSRPLTVAMPSPTSWTLPVSLRSSPAWKPWMASRMFWMRPSRPSPSGASSRPRASRSRRPFTL